MRWYTRRRYNLCQRYRSHNRYNHFFISLRVVIDTSLRSGIKDIIHEHMSGLFDIPV
jgi:hypothetical protein